MLELMSKADSGVPSMTPSERTGHLQAALPWGLQKHGCGSYKPAALINAASLLCSSGEG